MHRWFDGDGLWLWTGLCACFAALAAFLPLQTADTVALKVLESFGHGGATLSQVVVAPPSEIDRSRLTTELTDLVIRHGGAVAMTEDPESGFVVALDPGGMFHPTFADLQSGQALVSPGLAADEGFLETMDNRGHTVVGTIPSDAEFMDAAPLLVAKARPESFSAGYYLFAAPRGQNVDALADDLDQLWQEHGLDVVHEARGPEPSRWAALGTLRNPYTVFVLVSLGASLIGLMFIAGLPSQQTRDSLRIAASCGAAKGQALLRVFAPYAFRAIAGTLMGFITALWVALAIGQPVLASDPPPLLLEMADGALITLAVALLVALITVAAALRRVGREILW